MTVDQLDQVLDAVRRLPERPAPVPSPALAAFLARSGEVEILDTADELGARRARRGLFAAKVALAAACLTASGVAAAGAVTGVGPVPRLPVLERHAPAQPKSVKPAADKVSPKPKPTVAPVAAVQKPESASAAPDDDRTPVETRRHRHHPTSVADGRFSKRSHDDDRHRNGWGRHHRDHRHHGFGARDDRNDRHEGRRHHGDHHGGHRR